MPGLYVISGCSSGGKSTLVEALAERGLPSVPEPGRRVVAEEQASGGSALPWSNLEAFARRAVEMAKQDLAAVTTSTPEPTFFDRSLIDAATALEHTSGTQDPAAWHSQERYARTMFMVPPWSEIYETDSERRHSFAEACAEYERLTSAYLSLDFTIHILPLTGVQERADWLLGRLPSAE